MLPDLLARLAVFLLDLLFPPRCVFCGKIVAPGKKVCPDCSRAIIPLDQVRRMNLADCGKNIPCVVVYPYSGNVRKSILRFKFGGERQNAVFYADRIAEQLIRFVPDGNFDTVVPVPISAERKKKRGYNQSELIAARVAEKLQIPCENSIEKARDNPEQHRLKKTDRRNNVKNAYRCGGEGALGKRILLVDDIVTTGSTLTECARVLFGAGAESVVCSAVAESSLKIS